MNLFGFSFIKANKVEQTDIKDGILVYGTPNDKCMFMKHYKYVVDSTRDPPQEFWLSY